MPIIVDPFDRLGEDLRATFRPQREWIDKRGLLLVSAHFLSGVGAGTWLFAWLLGLSWGLMGGFLLVAAGALAHVLFLGSPQRFWRMVARPQSSWISRGLVAISVFLPFSLLYMVFLPLGSQNAITQALAILSLVGVAGILLYKGFVYAASRAIPFWNTPLLPPMYIAYGLRGGIAVLLVLGALLRQDLQLGSAAMIEMWIILSTAILLFFYLTVMLNAGVTSAESVRQLLRGRISWAFYGGVVIIGMVVPLVAGAVTYVSPLPPGVLALVAIASLVGDFYIKYSVSKAGVFVSLAGQFPTRVG